MRSQLGVGVDGIVVSGLAAFLPKFMEQQYQLSTGLAAQIVGLIVVPAGGGGTFLGGWIIKRFSLSRHSIILSCFLTQLLNIPLLFLFFMYCPTLSYVGINAHQLAAIPAAPTYFPISGSACNANCSCPPGLVDPVCGSDTRMYLSPCLAGCHAVGAGNRSDT